MAAVLLYFRQDLWRVAKAWVASLRRPEVGSELDARIGWSLVLATIPIAILGLAFKDPIEHGARDLYVIGTAMIVFGFVLLAADRMSKRSRSLEQINTRDGVF